MTVSRKEEHCKGYGGVEGDLSRAAFRDCLSYGLSHESGQYMLARHHDAAGMYAETGADDAEGTLRIPLIEQGEGNGRMFNAAEYRIHVECGLTFALNGVSKRAKPRLRASVFERAVRTHWCSQQ